MYQLDILHFCVKGMPMVRVSSGYLCNAEAPTEPTGETGIPYKLFFAGNVALNVPKQIT